MIGFFTDSGLSTPASRLSSLQATDGSAPVVDSVVYLGDPDASREWRAASDPGVDDIVVSLEDSESGASLLPSVFRLATTQGGLTAATPGAALTIDTAIIGGTSGAATVWLRCDTNTHAAGLFDNLSLAVNPLIAQDIA